MIIYLYIEYSGKGSTSESSYEYMSSIHQSLLNCELQFSSYGEYYIKDDDKDYIEWVLTPVEEYLRNIKNRLIEEGIILKYRWSSNWLD